MLNRITSAGQKVEVLSWKNGKPVSFSIEGKQSSLQKEIFEIAFPVTHPEIDDILRSVTEEKYVEGIYTVLNADKSISVMLDLQDGMELSSVNNTFWNTARGIAKKLQETLIDVGHKMAIVELDSRIIYHSSKISVKILVS